MNELVKGEQTISILVCYGQTRPCRCSTVDKEFLDFGSTTKKNWSASLPVFAVDHRALLMQIANAHDLNPASIAKALVLMIPRVNSAVSAVGVEGVS